MKKDNNLKVSIITVSYNASKTIEQAIQSVLNQTYGNIEYIIIDGASTDGTQDIISRYRDRLAYYVSEPDGGIYDAMNKGVQKATGDVIAFLGADDVYLDNALNYVVEQFEAEDIDLLWTRVMTCKNGKKRASHPVWLERMPYTIAGCHQGVYAKKKLFDTLGNFDTEYRIASDYEWLLRVVKSGSAVKSVDGITAVFSAEGASSQNRMLADEEYLAISMRYAEDDCMKQKILNYHRLKNNTRLLSGRIESGEYVRMDDDDVSELKDKNIVLFGTGEISAECSKLLDMNGIGVKCYFDNNENRWGGLFRGKPIVQPKNVSDADSVVIVATTAFEEEIQRQLDELGILRKNVVMYSAIRERICERMDG